MTDRPALVKIEQKADELEAHVYVTLEWNDREYLGQATGAPDESARARLLGEATLRAVSSLSATNVAFTLGAIATTSLGDSQVAMAQVEMPGTDPLVGSAMLRRDDPAAAPVRAVLDAINRKLEI